MSISIFISMMSLILSWINIKGEITMKETVLAMVFSHGAEVVDFF